MTRIDSSSLPNTNGEHLGLGDHVVGLVGGAANDRTCTRITKHLTRRLATQQPKGPKGYQANFLNPMIFPTCILPPQSLAEVYAEATHR